MCCVLLLLLLYKQINSEARTSLLCFSYLAFTLHWNRIRIALLVAFSYWHFIVSARTNQLTDIDFISVLVPGRCSRRTRFNALANTDTHTMRTTLVTNYALRLNLNQVSERSPVDNRTNERGRGRFVRFACIGWLQQSIFHAMHTKCTMRCKRRAKRKVIYFYQCSLGVFVLSVKIACWHRRRNFCACCD